MAALAVALAGCATTHKPPEIAYDDAAPAVQTVDPPAPVTVVELPRPLPLPGQMKPVERSRQTPEPTDPVIFPRFHGHGVSSLSVRPARG